MPMKYSGAKKKPVAKGKPARKKSAVRSKSAGKKVGAKRKADKKKLSVKSKAGKKKPAVKSVAARHKAPKKGAVKTKVLVKKKRAAAKVRKLAPHESQIVNTTVFSKSLIARRSSWQSGDLQGLSAIESADSESVEELLEEGNAFEAAVVMGVEDADNADLEEVRTHQVPEDDVPREYLDSD